MKVLIINNDFRVYWKGRLTYLHKFLATKNIALYAIELFGKGSPYAFDTYDNQAGWWNCLFPADSAAQLSKQAIKKKVFAGLDQLQPDIIIAPSIVFFAGALGIQWAKKNKKKFIMFDDARPVQVKRNPVVQWVKNLITAQADALWLPVEDYAADYARFRNKKVHFFYGFSCIDNSFFKPTAPVKHPAGNKIVCVARLVPIKNIDTLLKAWAIVEQNCKNCELQIIGDGPEYLALKQLSTSLQTRNVAFLGAVANANLPGYYTAADAFILPSLSETWGLVVNEAMASGLPVLLSYGINAAQSMLKQGINGFGFAPMDIDGMAETILRYIHLNEEARKNMSANALQTIDGMSYGQMGIKLYNALLKLDNTGIKKTNLLAAIIINRWDGRYNTTGWDVPQS